MGIGNLYSGLYRQQYYRLGPLGGGLTRSEGLALKNTHIHKIKAIKGGVTQTLESDCEATAPKLRGTRGQNCSALLAALGTWRQANRALHPPPLWWLRLVARVEKSLVRDGEDGLWSGHPRLGFVRQRQVNLQSHRVIILPAPVVTVLRPNGHHRVALADFFRDCVRLRVEEGGKRVSGW